MADIRALIAGDEEQAAPAVTRANVPVVQKTARTTQASSDVDRTAIFQSEYAKAKARLAEGDSRAAGDISALMREMKAIGITPVEPAMVAPATPVAPQIAPDARALIAGDGIATAAKPPPQSSVSKHFMDAFNTIQNAKKDIGSRIAGGIDVAYSALPMAAGAATQAIATPFVGPARAEQIGTQLSQFAGQPVGKALGITGEKAYQQPIGPIPGQIVEAIKDFAVNQGLTADQISAKTGIPPESVRNIAIMASFAIPEVAGMAIKPVVAAAREAMPAVVDAQGKLISPAGQPRIAPRAPQQLQEQFVARQAAEPLKPPVWSPPGASVYPGTKVNNILSFAEKPPVGVDLPPGLVSIEPPPRVEINAGFPPERRLPGAFGEEPVAAAEAQPVAAEMPASVGAAGVPPAMALRGSVDAVLANASPELQQFVGSKKIESLHLPSLETRALEEKHGVNLSVGQRTGDTQQYSTEWNRRGETPILGNHFNEQPAQISNAFETAKQKHAPDISVTADASELGQHEINALAAKDQVRRDAISSAYKALENENGGQFPIDIGKLDENINTELSKKLKLNHLPESIKADLKDFYKNPTFESYEALRTNLANEMRSSANGNARGAAYIVRQELENLPIFGEEAGTPQAARLKELADNARRLNAERMGVIKGNPAYKAAVKEAADAADASAQGESLNAAKFHNKYVSSATPESIRRMKAEIPENDIAHQAMVFGELSRAKNAAINASERNLTPEQFAKFYKQNKAALTESLSPQAMQDVTELGLLTSKIGMPKTGTFNYSNTYSSMLGDMAKEGLLTAGEAKLAGATGGMSIPVLGLARQFMGKLNKEGFAREATNPHGGLTKD